MPETKTREITDSPTGYRVTWANAAAVDMDNGPLYLFNGVVKSKRVDGWLWRCSDLHETRKAAMQCARDELYIQKGVKL